MLASLEVRSKISDLTDLDLRLAVAKEVFGHADIKVSDNGELTLGRRPRHPFFIHVPIRLPKWTKFHHAVQQLEEMMQHRQMWPDFLENLRAVVGKDNMSLATPRQKCEAAIAAVRAVNSAHP